MNSWHLSLTILAICTVAPLAAQDVVELKAQADINLPDGVVLHLQFWHFPGKDRLLPFLRGNNVPIGTYVIRISEKNPMENDCKSMGGDLNAIYFERNGFHQEYYRFEYRSSSIFDTLPLRVNDELPIIGRRLGLFRMPDEELIACSIICDE